MARSERRAGKNWWMPPLLFVLILFACAADPRLDAGLAAPGPCAVSSQTVEVDGRRTLLTYPSQERCGEEIVAPYPAIAFAHGFTMFGLFDGARDNRGHGEHLSSWGYVVAIPGLPDDFDTRYTAMQDTLSWLEEEASDESSALYQRVDVERLAVAGHSLGGATVLALASRDTRVRAVVALDPVYHTGGPGGGEALWDPAEDGPRIAVPTGILGAPASDCNADADYARIYPEIGATHKASYTLVGGSHCDFNDPGGALCGVICSPADPARAELSQAYMTAWFNYYLHLDDGSYEQLYGETADADVREGRIEREAHTEP